MKILSTILRVLLYLVLGATIVFNALNSYILFAPDVFPKPFYVQYANPPAVVIAPDPVQPMPTPMPNETPVETSTPSPCLFGLICLPGSATEEPQGTSAPLPTAIDVKSITPGQGIMVDTGAKVVNLADPGGRRFVRVSVVLEFAPENPLYYTSTGDAKNAIVSAFTTELSPKLPIVNDVLVTVLSSKTFEQVYLPEGKDSLRKEIIAQLGVRLPEYKVISVYFTEFAVQ
jgi:flagellar protein FliL